MGYPGRWISGSSRSFDVQVSAWFAADGATIFGGDVEISARGSSGASYAAVGDCRRRLLVYEVVQPDQSIEGFVCFAIEPPDTDGLQLVMTRAGGAGDSVVMNIPAPPEPTQDDFGPDDVVAALREGGVDARLVHSPYGRSEFMERSTAKHVLCLDGQESNLYAYADGALREADSDPASRTI